MIEISEAAVAEIERMQAVRTQTDRRFRIGFARGGCKDFYYTVDLVNSNEDDDNDLPYNVNGISLSIDLHQLAYLEHLKLDYSEDLMGGGFRFENPLATTVCGCGNSFSIAHVESERWQLPT